MAHTWEEVTPDGIDGIFTYGHRRCTRCGAQQEKVQEQLWMRVTGYRWVPLVGRCPKDKEDRKKKNE